MPAKVTRSAAKAKPAPHKPTFPVREPAKIEPINRANVKAVYVGRMGFHGWIWAQHVAFGTLLLTATWFGFQVHRTMALAEVGAVTCSAENSMMWLEDDPGSDVPRLNDAVLMQCARAYRPFE